MASVKRLTRSHAEGVATPRNPAPVPLPFETSRAPPLVKASRFDAKSKEKEGNVLQPGVDFERPPRDESGSLTSRDSKPARLLTLWPAIILHGGTLRSAF